MKSGIPAVSILLLGLGLLVPAANHADTLTIYDLQFSTEEDDWKSPYEGQVVSVVGGVVTHKYRNRIAVQDPDAGDAWAALQIRAFEDMSPLNAVSVGDRVDFHDVYVEEFRGGTIPQFKSYSSFIILSSGNPLPEPVTVPLEDLRYPPNREACEKYESMLLAVEDVRVGRMDWGKADDNYQLFSGADTTWASDYANLDLAIPPFPTYYVSRGERYGRIVGIFEEYYYPQDNWDYYQLLPRSAADYTRSDLYTIRDVQESSADDAWRSLLVGDRINLRGIVSSRRSHDGLFALADPVLGNAWAGVFVMDTGGELADLALGDELDLRNVLVEEHNGLTVLTYDGQSAHLDVGSGKELLCVRIPPRDLSRNAGPEAGEKYEGMRVSVYNAIVAKRGVPEGNDLYYVVAGEDTLLATDLLSEVVPADSVFFVREGDRLGRIQGVVVERECSGTSCYVLQPQVTEDYWFVGEARRLASWGRIKQRFRQGGS